MYRIYYVEDKKKEPFKIGDTFSEDITEALNFISSWLTKNKWYRFCLLIEKDKINDDIFYVDVLYQNLFFVIERLLN